MQKFTFVFKHKQGALNRVANVLSRRSHLLTTISSTLIAFEHIKGLYPSDSNFHDIWSNCLTHTGTADFHIHDGLLFKGPLLCIPNTSLRLLLVEELHANGLAAHLGRDKTTLLVIERYY
ncbi:hypothetical protein Sjap_022855 [Stephania japonica]|uniref:Integrase zinc-binding domain-containing protein n=1 Tax=Stephania japonica TaxID=461633 RepID=A0AAP0EWU2_9MAGN